MRKRDPKTVAAANGIASDPGYGAVTPPLYLSSTFAFSGFEKHRGYEYSRTANPSRDVLADRLAKLESGAGAVITSSGMAAVDLILSLAGRDDLVVAPHDCYGGTYRLLSARRDRGNFDLLFVDQSDAAQLASAFARASRRCC
jgi:cystathionine gamma-synthase